MDASTRVEFLVVGPLPLIVALLEHWGSAKSLTTILLGKETHRRLSQLKPIQHKILELLDVPDNALRTFKRRYEMGGTRETSEIEPETEL